MSTGTTSCHPTSTGSAFNIGVELGQLVIVVVALPLLLIVGLPGPAGLPYIAASLVIHIGYYIALAGAYQHGDLGLTYPIMRGFAPLLVALASGSPQAGDLGVMLSVLAQAGAPPIKRLDYSNGQLALGDWPLPAAQVATLQSALALRG
jgi:hypothetical protein